MPIAEIRIDDATWAAGSPERQREWRAAITDLIEEQSIAASGQLLLRFATLEDGSLHVDVEEEGAPPRALALPIDRLRPHFDEYFTICRDMGKLKEGAQSPRLEALDIAKRIAHDEAAETVLELLRSLGPDRATCRRMFTLLVTLHFDTTRLLLPHHLAR